MIATRSGKNQVLLRLAEFRNVVLIAGVRVPAGDLGPVGAGGEEGGGIAIQDWVKEVGCDLGQGAEDEFAEVETRMGDGEEFRCNFHIAEEQDIEIGGSRCVAVLFAAAEEVFDPEQAGHHLAGTDLPRYLYLGDHVQEPCIAIDLPRFGLVDRREFADVKTCFDQPANG